MTDDKHVDEESKGAKKNKKQKSGPKATAKAKPVETEPETVEVEELEVPEQKISLFLAVGLIVSALVVGLVVGYMVAPKGPSNDLVAPTEAGTAPALTPEQLDSTELPATHPALPGTEELSDETGTDTQAPENGEDQPEQSDEPAE